MRAVQFRRFEQYEIELHDLTLVELKFCPVGPCFSAFDLAGSGWLAVSEVSDIRDHQQPYRQATEETRLGWSSSSRSLLTAGLHQNEFQLSKFDRLLLRCA
jgi:hypothetical protein